MPLTTQRHVNQLLAGIERPALPAFGLAGPDLMIPRPVEAENTARGLLDDHGPLIDQLAGEGLTTRQAILIIRVTVGTRDSVGTPARWAWRRWAGQCRAVRRFARALGSFVTCLHAAATPILGIQLLRRPLDGSEQLLLPLLHLSLGSHEGGDYFQLRLLLEPELRVHGDIPMHAGLAG